MTVTAANTLTGKKYSVATALDGSYKFSGLARGRYVVRVEFMAFAPQTQEIVLKPDTPTGKFDAEMILASRQAEQSPAASAIAAIAAGRGFQSLSIENSLSALEGGGDGASASGGGATPATLRHSRWAAPAPTQPTNPSASPARKAAARTSAAAAKTICTIAHRRISPARPSRWTHSRRPNARRPRWRRRWTRRRLRRPRWIRWWRPDRDRTARPRLQRQPAARLPLFLRRQCQFRREALLAHRHPIGKSQLQLRALRRQRRRPAQHSAHFQRWQQDVLLRRMERLARQHALRRVLHRSDRGRARRQFHGRYI